MSSVVRHVRRWWPWVAGVVILALVARRIPLDAFRDAIEHGPHVQLGLVMLALTCGILCTDSLTVWVGLRAWASVAPSATCSRFAGRRICS